MNVFTYGSLMYPRVWSRVVTQAYTQKIGVVQGFRRLQVNNQPYPGLIKGEGKVEGVVYLDISPQDLARLDHFEGELYRRDEVAVACRDGANLRAFVYIIRDEYQNILGDEWLPEEFERSGLAEFEAKYQGFERM